jgi:hypothetical protein
VSTSLGQQANSITQHATPDKQLERLSFYLLDEIQNEIDLGSKVAAQILYRAFKRVEAEKGDY